MSVAPARPANAATVHAATIPSVGVLDLTSSASSLLDSTASSSSSSNSNQFTQLYHHVYASQQQRTGGAFHASKPVSNASTQPSASSTLERIQPLLARSQLPVSAPLPPSQRLVFNNVQSALQAVNAYNHYDSNHPNATTTFGSYDSEDDEVGPDDEVATDDSEDEDNTGLTSGQRTPPEWRSANGGLTRAATTTTQKANVEFSVRSHLQAPFILSPTRQQPHSEEKEATTTATMAGAASPLVIQPVAPLAQTNSSRPFLPMQPVQPLLLPLHFSQRVAAASAAAAHQHPSTFSPFGAPLGFPRNLHTQPFSSTTFSDKFISPSNTANLPHPTPNIASPVKNIFDPVKFEQKATPKPVESVPVAAAATTETAAPAATPRKPEPVVSEPQVVEPVAPVTTTLTPSQPLAVIESPAAVEVEEPAVAPKTARSDNAAQSTTAPIPIEPTSEEVDVSKPAIAPQLSASADELASPGESGTQLWTSPQSSPSAESSQELDQRPHLTLSTSISQTFSPLMTPAVVDQSFDGFSSPVTSHGSLSARKSEVVSVALAPMSPVAVIPIKPTESLPQETIKEELTSEELAQMKRNSEILAATMDSASPPVAAAASSSPSSPKEAGSDSSASPATPVSRATNSPIDNANNPPASYPIVDKAADLRKSGSSKRGTGNAAGAGDGSPTLSRRASNSANLDYDTLRASLQRRGSGNFSDASRRSSGNTNDNQSNLSTMLSVATMDPANLPNRRALLQQQQQQGGPPELGRRTSFNANGGAPLLDRRASVTPSSPVALDRRGSTMMNPANMFDRRGSVVAGGPLAPRLAHNILLQLDQLLMSNIPSEAFEHLETLKATMQTVQNIIMASESEQAEIGTDVEVLSAILKTQHSFDGNSVDAYRAAAGMFQHKLFQFTAWACPQYISTSPIPNHVRNVNITFHLPVEHFTFVSGGIKAPKFDVTIGLDDTVDMAMRRAYAAYNETLPAGIQPPIHPMEEPQPETLAFKLVCKVLGFNDYFLPERRMLEYEFVRHAVRNSTSIELLIVERPTEIHPNCAESIMPKAVWEELEDWRRKYEDKIKRFLVPLNKHRFNDTNKSFSSMLASSSSVPRLPHSAGLQFLPITELNSVPFRVRTIGIERVSSRALPRLANSSIFGEKGALPGDSVDLFVRVYLLHGMSKLNHVSNSNSPLLRYDCSAPRWTGASSVPAWTQHAWITPPPANLYATFIPYAKLPHNTRVLFLLYGTPAVSAGGVGGSSAVPAASNAANAATVSAANVIKEKEEKEAASKHAGPLSPRSAVARQAAKEAQEAAAAKQAAANAPPADAPSTTATHHRSDSTARTAIVESRLKNEVLLGWSATQLVDEYGTLMSGRQELNLWTFGCGLHEKDYNYGSLTGNKEDLNQILRGTNKHNAMPVPSNAVAEKFEKEIAKHHASGSHAPPPAAQAGVTTFASLTVEFDKFALPVMSPLMRRSTNNAFGTTAKSLALSMHPRSLDKIDRRQLAVLMHADPLYTITSSDRELLWLTRTHLVYHPSMLPKFLACIDWTNAPIVAEAHKLLKVWSPPVEAVSALELLDAKYPDPIVREYAVQILDDRMTDSELQLYLLQLTQCLKFEAYHDSALSRFLLRRSLANPYQIGHHFFWHLKAEMSQLDFQERFTLIIEEYLTYAGLHAKELRKQNTVVQKLQKIAELIVKLKVEEKKSDSEATKEYHDRLSKLNRDFFFKLDGGNGTGKFQIPLNPKLEARGLIVEKCKFMSSKKVPLWLVFENADPLGPPIYIIFKSGDDLRQDILTLQLLKVMDKIWLENGIDCRLKPYKCIATGVNDAGEGVGMIEVVMGSDTTSGIQLKYGGGAIGALKLDPLDLFIRNYNPQGAPYERAVDNFIRSCAGYCVATFVLGIGDRHNGNIMCTKEGHLFHIDFGHFLGNFKKKFGFNRERSAFVFTPEMAYVMGGRNFKKSPLFKLFLDCCFKAFNTLRRHAATLENLFLLMCSAGMPELMEREDVLYLRDMLCLGLTEKQAEKRFKVEIDNSLDGTWRRIDNWIHNAKHG